MVGTPSTRVDGKTAAALMGAFVALGLTFAAIFVIPPLITVFVDDLGLTHAQAGDLMTAYLVGYVLASLVAGQLADRFGAVAIMTAGLALGSASTFLFVATEELGLFLLARLGIGIATGLVYAPGIAFVARLLPPRLINSGVGVYTSGLSGGILVVFTTTPLLEEATSWRWAAITFGIALVAGMVFFLITALPMSARASRPGEIIADAGIETKKLLTDSTFVRVCISLFLAMFVAYGVYTWIAPYLDEVAGFSAGQISFALALSVAAGIPSTLLAGWLADRSGKPLRVASIGFSMVTALLVLAAVDQISFALATIVAIIATFGTAGALVPLFVLPSRVVEATGVAKATGIATAIAMSGALVSTVLGGRLVGWTDGYTVPFIVYVAAMAGAVIVIFPLASTAVRQRQALEFGVGRLADILQITPLVLGAEGDGDPVRTGARGPTDAVDILFGHVGQLVIDHVADARNVDPARSHVGRDQHRRLGALELVERAFALRLALIAVDRIRLDASLRQLLHHAVAAMLGAREDQHALDLAGHLMAARQDQFEQALLFVLLDHEEILLDPFGGGAFGRHADLHGSVAIGADEFLDLLRHGRAEVQRLALLRRELVDLAQRVDEAEVEHLVRLVQHQHFDAVEIERLLVDQVEQAARGRDENVGPAMQLVAILVDRSAADDRMDLEVRASGRAPACGRI